MAPLLEPRYTCTKNIELIEGPSGSLNAIDLPRPRGPMQNVPAIAENVTSGSIGL